MGMDDFLKAFSGGDDQPTGDQAADPLADLLGGLLGGSGGQQDSGGLGGLLEAITNGAGSEGGPGMDDLLQGLLGGGAQGGSGDITDMLGAVLGGSQAAGAGSFLGPIVNSLAEKLGLPPAIAQMVVSFVMGKLLTGQRGGRPIAPLPQAGVSSQAQGLDLDSLLERMTGSRGVDDEYVRSTGMADELAEKTGLDPDAAAKSLQEVLGMLGGQLGGQQQDVQPKQGGLDDLLENW